MEQVKMSYKKDFLNFLNNLSGVTSSLILKKDGQNINIFRANASRTLAYFLTVNAENFGFPGEEISFYNYPEFYQLSSCMENADLIYSKDDEREKIIIKKDNSKINYILSDSENIKPGPKSFEFNNPDFIVNFSVEDIANIKKMISILNTDKIKITCSGTICNFHLFNSSHDNSFNKEYACEKNANGVETLEYSILAETFSLIPSGSYKMELKKEGVVSINLNHPEYKLNFVTAESKE